MNTDQLIGLLLVLVTIGLLVYRIWIKASVEKKKLLEKPFPEEWKALLEKKVYWYKLLKPEEKAEFEKRILLFLYDKQIIALEKPIDDDFRLLVAASAIIPVFGFKNFSYRNLSTVYIVDGIVNEDADDGLILGQVEQLLNSSQMVLSKQALESGFEIYNDRKNVGVHEFAHLIDGADGRIDGIPYNFIDEKMIKPWSDLMYEHMKAIEENESDIDSYALTGPEEFFAVVSEYFFERPDVMKENHPELYTFLQKIFKQDRSKSFSQRFTEAIWIRKTPGRNDKCPCGSGKKYKHCCLKHN